MALFGKKNKQEEAKDQSVVAAPKAVATNPAFRVSIGGKHPGSVILSPRITEKSAYLSQHNAYAFDVSTGASKEEIAQAVRAIYKVSPVRVRVMRVPGKRVMTRSVGRIGRTASGKKAYVFLKKGETIEIV